jgi:Gly-Xaa carboxypeptidase
VGDDPRWDIFADFHTYLRASFPKTFAVTRVTTVNTYNLVLRWEGSDLLLKPILLTAHQDVVPVEPSTVSSWKYPPYSGHFDGERVSAGTIPVNSR